MWFLALYRVATLGGGGRASVGPVVVVSGTVSVDAHLSKDRFPMDVFPTGVREVVGRMRRYRDFPASCVSTTVLATLTINVNGARLTRVGRK